MTETGFALLVRTPAQMLQPAEADAIVRTELAPAMLALVERAHGGTGKDGHYMDVAPSHALLVLPVEVEALSMAELEQLAGTLATLRHRAQRAMRLRRSRSDVRPPAAWRPRWCSPTWGEGRA